MNLKATIDNIHDNRAIAKFCLLIFLTEFIRGAYLNFIPLYSEYVLKYSVDTIGAVVCAFYLAETLSQIFVGMLLDRFNNRVILAGGLLVSFFSLIMLKFIISPLMIIIDGAVFGFGFAPVWIIVLGYISKFDEHKRTVSMSIVYSSWLAGIGLGSVLVSFLIGRGYMFALTILISLWGVSVVFGALIKEGIKKEDAHIDIKKSLKMTYSEINNKKYLVPGMLLQTLSISILLPIAPIYITNEHYLGLSTDQYGIALLAIGIITIFFMMLFGSFNKKIGTKNLYIYGMFLTALCILGIGNIKTIYTLLFLGILLAISYSAILPAWNSILSNNIREEIRGMMWGSFSTIEGMGRAGGSLIGGILGNSFNLHFSFNISVITLLSLSIYYFYLNKKKILN